MQGSSRNGPDSEIVSPAILAGVVRALRQDPIHFTDDLLATEPTVSEFVGRRELQLIGRMALAGASPEFLQGFANEMHNMVAVVAHSFRRGYRDLLQPFVPLDTPDGTESPPGVAPPPPPAADDDEADIPF